jgi:TonB-dependent starch-binding outer membrane protein SusC
MSTSTRRSRAPALLGLALLPFVLDRASAEQLEAPLQGVVADDLTGEVIASARVTIVGTQLETRTSEAGTFAFEELPYGKVSVRVQARGYPAITDEVTIAPDQIVFMHVVLPQVSLILDEVLVRGERRARAPQPMAQEREARTAADILARQVPGVNQTGGIVGKNNSLIVLRGVSSINLSSEPAVFLDGVRLGSSLGEAMDALSKIPAEHVRQIRVMRGPAAAFVQGAANGAIFVETRMGPEERR